MIVFVSQTKLPDSSNPLSDIVGAVQLLQSGGQDPFVFFSYKAYSSYQLVSVIATGFIFMYP